MEQTAYRDLVRFRSELPERVLEAAIKIKGLQLSAFTDEGNCAYCRSIENGDMGDGLEVCEHYERVMEAGRIEFEEIRPTLAKAEEDLLWRDDRLEWAATEAQWGALEAASRARGIPNGYVLRNLWESLSEGYYAVPDPRADVDEMTYWRRKDKGKNKRPAFDPWPAKARYGPFLTSWDQIPYKKGSEEARWYLRAWSEIMSGSYRHAIVEAIATDPVAAQQRFADWNIRCCVCGKGLQEERSKVYGIGPECRKGMPAEVLDNYYRPKVGRVHAKHLAHLAD